MNNEANKYIEKLPGFTATEVTVFANISVTSSGVIYTYESDHCSGTDLMMVSDTGIALKITFSKEQAEVFANALLEPGTLPRHLKRS